MDYDTFVGEVRNRAQLPTREDAVRVTRITLETLSERLDPGEATNLAAQLPEEIGHRLTKVDDVARFDWETFVDRLVVAGGYDSHDTACAIHHARSVIDVVEAATSAGELDDVRTQLPEAFEELFVLADQPEKPVDEEQRPGDERTQVDASGLLHLSELRTASLASSSHEKRTRRDLNPRHPGPEPGTLSTELRALTAP